MISAFFTLLVIAITGYIIKTVIKPKNFPPGPRWYPFVGSSNVAESMTKKYGSQWKGFSELAKEYSTHLLGLKLGSDLYVIVYGEKAIRHVFTEAEFEGRPNSFFIRLRCLGKRMGITFSDGPMWKVHRQFTVKQLKNVGFGKTTMESEIQVELRSILQYISDNNSKPINPKSILASSVMNILWRYTAGERIKKERLTLLLEHLSTRSKAFSMAGGWLNQMPWCRFIIPNLSGYALIKKVNQEISEIIEDAIIKHKNHSIVGNDFIYSFMEEMKKEKNIYTEEQLKIICLDILIAGSQTSSNLLEFSLLMCLRYKMIQEKIYNEIRNVIGDATPCWADSNRLIYTSAFLLEVQRYFCIVPLAGPRRVLQDTHLDGYFIPKETIVLMSLGDIHMDPELWDNPHEFRPERFIDERGALKYSEHLYTFGLGRRRCPGDALAKSFLFITFTGIIQNYKIECSNGIMPSEDPILGLISAPKPYVAEFTKRS